MSYTEVSASRSSGDATHETAPAEPAVRLASVHKVYRPAGNPVTALRGVSLDVAPGSFSAVMGPSGSGKSTLLQIAAGLDRPTRGEVYVGGVPIGARSETALTKFRRERIGFVFQELNLLAALTVRQNVALPLRLAGRPIDRGRCEEILDRVGLGDRLEHRPAELSGGEQQRVAIARALVTEPAAILADEPTGALDSRSGRDVLALLGDAVRIFGQTVVMVTHDPVAAAHADCVWFLADGQITGQLTDPSADAVAGRLTCLAEGLAPRRASAAAEKAC